MKIIHTEIDIDAPADRVWQVLTDFARFPDWNPFIRQISGELKIGARLEMKSLFFGSRIMTFRSRVLKVEPHRELRWRGHFLIPRLFDGAHYFILEARGSDRTHFIHDEIFTGLLVPLFGKWLDQDTRRGFEEMNAALKLRTEKGQPCLPPIAARDFDVKDVST